jgi:hypothetical protein
MKSVRTMNHERLHAILAREKREREQRAVTAAPPSVETSPCASMGSERYRAFDPETLE